MEKEKTRGRTRRKQPSQVAGFLYREGRKWCAAALSLCMILNNMASVTWAAESAAEKEVIFKLTSRSLYEALQEAVREETMADDHFLFEGKEKDVEAYEKLLLLDDDLYELKPEFENKDEVTKAEKKNDLQLRIFASLGWETDPEREYQVVGDEKIIFCLSNASETEQMAVIQVDEKTTEEIILVPGSAVVIDSKGEEESLEAESGEESKEDRKEEENESGESEGQAEEENNSEGIKGVGGNGGAGGASGGNGGNSGNGSNGGNSSNSSDSSNSSEREDIVESGSSAEGEDFAESEGTVESETSAKNEGSAENESSVENKNSAENEGKADESAADAEENRNDETQEKADAESKQDKESKDGQETVNKPETGNSQDITKEPENTNTQENINTQDKAEEKPERKDEEVKNSSASKKEETEKPDKTEAGSNESGKSDKAEAGSNESEKSGKEESGNTDSGKADKADKPDKTDKSDNKESSKPETSEKSESGNTSTGKGEKSDTEKSGSERSGNSDSSKKSERTKKSSDSGSSDNSSDKGKEVSEGISRNVIRLVADNLEVSVSDDKEETESVEETTIIDTQEEQKEETIEEESEEIKIETEEVKTELEEAETEEVTTKTEEVKAETASPSDVEDNEIEGELYAPVVVNEESIIVFVTTAEELGLNRAELRKASDSNAKRISPAYEGEVELENVIVQVKADENVLPEGVKLQVKELKEEGEDAAQYEEAKEALDSQGTEYDGMMALDISFLDKKGREIEPDGNVQVSIKVKKEALPEEADLESIAVQHLAEDEGEIFVEEVADCGDKTRGKVDIEAEEHIEAAFEVESFSSFIITWGNDGDYVATLTVSWVGENDQSLSDENDVTTIAITKAEKFSLYDRFGGKNFEGYEFERAEVNAGQLQLGEYNIPGETISKTIDNAMEIEIETRSVTYPWEPGYCVNIYPQTQNGTVSTPVVFPVTANLHVEVKLHYKKAGISTAQLKITDEIETSGLLTVGPLDGETEAEGAKYAWYKQVNGIWERIERKKISGDLYNIPEETGKSINVALDDGARCYYKAELLDAQGKETGIKSEAFLVEYYDALQDGSFEDVKIPLSWSENGTGEGGKWAQLTDSTEGFKWKSTTGKIELVNGESYLHQPGADELLGYPKGAYDGKQFAELNPQTDGALYQDVLTVPGAKLNWEFYHKARDPRSVPGIDVKDGTVTGKSADTMYLLIMPKQLAEGITSQAQVLEVIHNYQNYPGAYMVERTTALEEGWKRYGSSYVVGDNQYVTRFFFVAGPTISGSSSVGNFLDKVWFSSQLPPPAEGYGDLVVNKTVSGLAEAEAEEYQILLTLSDGKTERTITLDGFSKNLQNGAYTDSATFDNLAPGNYTITESIDRTLSENLENIHGQVQSYVAVNQENAQQGISANITIKEGETVSVNFNNAYLRPGGSFTVKKIFKNGKQFENETTKFTGVKFKLEKEGETENSSNKEATVLNEEITYEGNDAIAKFEFSSILEGTYKLKEIETPSGYRLLTEDITIVVGIVDGVFGCYLKKDDGSLKSIASMGGIVEVINEEKEEIPGAILPDTGGPGLAMFERYGWFLLMLALMMAGIEVRCYGERKYKRAVMTQREAFEDSM